MIEGTGRKSATFEQILEENRPGLDGIHSDEYLRGDVTEGGVENRKLYVHTALMPEGSGATALARRLEKVKGAQIVAASIATRYGSTVAENVLLEVSEKTNRKLWEGVTRNDLLLLEDELQLQLIKDDLAGNWASAAKEQHYPVLSHGNTDIVVPSSKDGYYPIQDGDAEVVGLRPLIFGFKEGPGPDKVDGPRPIYGVKEEYSSVPWPGSDAKVGLREVIHTDHIQRSRLHFNEMSGTLTLNQGEQGDGEENKRALTRFIDKHFEVKPGHQAFQNIANNILSYLPQRGVASTLQETVQNAAADVGRTVGAERAEIDGDAVRRVFTLKMQERNVTVGGDTNIPYRTIPGLPDNLKGEFRRQESFTIAGEHLRVDPLAFDAKANLLEAVRQDKVEIKTTHDRMLALAGLTGTFLERFTDALQQRSTWEKMIGDDDQVMLGEIFGATYEDRDGQGLHLAPEHFDALRNEWRDDAPEAFAFRLLCMAALYTNYSSSRVFGTEHESPNALRGYTEALLRKVHELDPGLLPAGGLADWVNRLRGNAFADAGVLYDLMSRQLNALLGQERAHGPLHRVHDAMIPRPWR